MLKAINISKKYKNNKEALSKVSFELHANEIVAIVGPNGAGKSTLLRIAAGINSSSEGGVVREEGIRLGAVFDGNGLYSQLTAYENLSFFYRLNKNNLLEKEVEKIDGLLMNMELSEVKNQKVKEFSKGMARKLAIARALLTNPDILLMDEPFDGLDIASHAFLVSFLRNWVKEKKHAVIFTSHNMSDVELLCDRVLMLKKGQLLNNLSMFDLNNKVTSQYKITVEENVGDWRLLLGNQTYFNQVGEKTIILENGLKDANQILEILVNRKLTICEFMPVYKSMEDIYLSEVGGAE